MYDLMDRHGGSMNVYTYDSTKLLDAIDKLKKEKEELEEELEKYKNLAANNNINVIDGRICYRELEDFQVDSMEMTSDYNCFLKCSGTVIYKDVETDVVMAKRKIKIGDDDDTCIKL